MPAGPCCLGPEPDYSLPACRNRDRHRGLRVPRTGRQLLHGTVNDKYLVSGRLVCLQPSGPQVGQPVSFTGSASGGTPSYSYAWIFGDSSTGTGRTASHSYSSAGTYTATLTVTDAIGQTAEQLFSVAVHGLLNHPPSLSLPGPRSAILGSTLVFAVNTSDLDLGAVVTLVAAGLPSSPAFAPATGHFPRPPSANDVGSYTVTFTATDNGSPPL